jgi:hypothetical protein
VRVLPGETALAFYTATNKSNSDIIGVATYSVTPGQVSPYFSKIQCFCFEEQRLNAGESVDMPVFFFIDPDFLNDPAMRNIDTITLSYTFFSTYLFRFIPAFVYSFAEIYILSDVFCRSSVRRQRRAETGACVAVIAPLLRLCVCKGRVVSSLQHCIIHIPASESVH